LQIGIKDFSCFFKLSQNSLQLCFNFAFPVVNRLSNFSAISGVFHRYF
jgi:hypothetical protein